MPQYMTKKFKMVAMARQIKPVFRESDSGLLYFTSPVDMDIYGGFATRGVVHDARTHHHVAGYVKTGTLKEIEQALIETPVRERDLTALFPSSFTGNFSDILEGIPASLLQKKPVAMEIRTVESVRDEHFPSEYSSQKVTVQLYGGELPPHIQKQPVIWKGRKIQSP